VLLTVNKVIRGIRRLFDSVWSTGVRLCGPARVADLQKRWIWSLQESVSENQDNTNVEKLVVDTISKRRAC
jgi:hypothetical protein